MPSMRLSPPREPIGILAGVPIAFKDNMNLVGTHTTCASHMLESYVSPFTATCVAKALDAGGICLGKTNMDEFAFGSSTETSYFGTTGNPWDLERVPGGSSGGSAAAVAAGMATLSLGSDTGGSIRQPGSFCGTVALKPSYGVVSRYGVVAFGSSLDQVGPFARSVEDAAYALNAISGRDPLDCTSQPCDIDFTANLDAGVNGMRIGIVPALLELDGLTSEVKHAFEESVARLEGAGSHDCRSRAAQRGSRHQRLLRARTLRGVLESLAFRFGALRTSRPRQEPRAAL